ncbi:YIP1 family protein [Poseidonocella sedimentorum]|uniref:Yip1 domain-containing protein n=1 Tax=Poseidonocella sedimentorum TaxID=871652 RepID=A0A1I6EPC6_9RHOB|nr:YIP1 family protein [Poseidonocella sedimentorum]SFR19570.1 hypothetical protein SAMN04515673_11722 [Poseidonocella sedimentorum]
MDLTLSSIGRLALRSLIAPREAADTLLSLSVPRNALWMMLVIAALIATLCTSILIQIIGAMIPSDLEGGPEMIFSGLAPLALAAQTVFSLCLISFLQFWIGARLLGGGATLEDVVLVNIWWQSLASVSILLSFLVVLAIPLLGGWPALGLLLYLVWIFLVFLDRAEGFGSVLKALLQVIVSGFAMIVVSILISSLFAPFLGAPV